MKTFVSRGRSCPLAVSSLVILFMLGLILLLPAGSRVQAAPGGMSLCSCTTAGTQGNAISWISRISDNGRYVAFQSSATNLIPGISGQQIYLKDLQTGAIALCSCDSSGTQGNGTSNSPNVSADGRYVFFASNATNLVPVATSKQQVFRKNMQTGEVKLCSSRFSGTYGNDRSDPPSASADGRYVAFDSYATDLLASPTTGIQVFLKDLQTGQIIVCSTNASGIQGDSTSAAPILSQDARRIVFYSIATNLGYGGNAHRQVYCKNLETGAIDLCSCDLYGALGNQESYGQDITPDGRYVAMQSNSTNLVPGSDGDQIYRKDLQTGKVELCSCDALGTKGDLNSVGSSMSADGRCVAFDTFATNLVPGVTSYRQAYRKDLDTGDIIVVSCDTAGNPGNGNTSNPHMTPDAKYISFSSLATNLMPGTSNEQVFRKELADPGNTFYFAEGYTGSGFQEYLCLGQPGTTPLDVAVTYLFADGTSQQATYTVPAKSRLTVNVNNVVGPDKQVSIKCFADAPFVAERPMYFNYTGAGPSWTGGHDSVGATKTSQVWYFAEGYTGTGFDEWISVLNPGDTVANLTFKFQTQEEGEKVVSGLAVGPHSRGSFKANTLLEGKSFQTSLMLTSTQPVVAERPMYFNYQGKHAWNWTGGHCVMGSPDLASQYYFAEGTTRSNFEEWLCIQNPNPADISVHAVYQLGQGTPIEKDYTVEANKRSTLYVPDQVGQNQDVSVLLTSASPFLAERPMYFNYQGTNAWNWTGGHCVIGAANKGTDWFFAEGYTGQNFEEWLCIQNPGATPANVTINYYPEGGGVPIVKPQPPIPPNSRYTVLVNTDAGSNLNISAEVTSDQPLIVERPMYFNYNGVWSGGHDVVGYMP